MTFKQVKIVSTIILVLSLTGYLVTAFLMNRGIGSADTAAYTATGLLILGIVLRMIWGKCPHCGGRITRKDFNKKICPYCGKDLMK